MIDTIQARVQANGTPLAPCPACGELQPVRGDPKGQDRREHFVTCSCGHRYRVCVEHRRAHRRHVDLAGTYRSDKRPGQEGIAFIRNLSMTGVGFQTPQGHVVEKGERLQVSFVPDRSSAEEIRVSVIVRHIRPTYLGCQFTELTPQDEARLVEFLASIP